MSICSFKNQPLPSESLFHTSLNRIFGLLYLPNLVCLKLASELLPFGKNNQREIRINYEIYLSFVQQISLSCPDYHQEIDTKHRADRCKNHIISCFSKSGEFYKHFIEIDRIWSNDKAPTKRCEMIASTLKYLVVRVISNLDKKIKTLVSLLLSILWRNRLTEQQYYVLKNTLTFNFKLL